MKTALQLLGVIILSVVLLLAVVFGIAWLRGASAPFFGSMDAEVQIESANSRIARYEHFFDLCSSVEGYEAQLVVLQEQLENTDSEDRKEINRLTSTIAGLEGQRARAISQYNADAMKEYTDARFRASSLPYQLELEEETNCDTY